MSMEHDRIRPLARTMQKLRVSGAESEMESEQCHWAVQWQTMVAL